MIIRKEDIISKKVDVSFVIVGKSTKFQKEQISQAFEILSRVINDNRMRVYIRDHNYMSDGSNICGFAQSNMGNVELLTRFVEGNERGISTVDYKWDFVIKFYRKYGSVIGYTNVGSKQINLNTKFMGRTVPHIVNTLIHEYVHVVGGTHSYKRSKSWPDTSPYAIGAFAESLAAGYLGLSLPSAPFEPPVSLLKRFSSFFT